MTRWAKIIGLAVYTVIVCTGIVWGFFFLMGFL